MEVGFNVWLTKNKREQPSAPSAVVSAVQVHCWPLIKIIWSDISKVNFIISGCTVSAPIYSM